MLFPIPGDAGDRERQKSYTSSTVIASSSHVSTQLSHPRHSSILTGLDLSSTISNTSTGQTSTHSSQPTHFPSSTVTVKDMLKVSFHKKKWVTDPLSESNIKKTNKIPYMLYGRSHISNKSTSQAFPALFFAAGKIRDTSIYNEISIYYINHHSGRRAPPPLPAQWLVFLAPHAGSLFPLPGRTTAGEKREPDRF